MTLSIAILEWQVANVMQSTFRGNVRNESLNRIRTIDMAGKLKGRIHNGTPNTKTKSMATRSRTQFL